MAETVAGRSPDEQTTDRHTGGQGSPVVLLHGINMSWRVWRPVLPLLQAEHEVHALTLPGHRGAEALAEPGGMAELADQLESTMDKMGLQRAHLVGNSLGGWLACELAARGRARSVVAFSPAGGFRGRRDFARLARLLRLARRLAGSRTAARMLADPRLRRLALRPTNVHGDRVPTEEIPGMLADTLACTVLDGLLASVRAGGHLRGMDIPADCPVLLAWARRDRTIPFPRYGKPFAAAVPRAEVRFLPGVGHVPMYDDPELVARTVLDFTARVEGN